MPRRSLRAITVGLLAAALLAPLAVLAERDASPGADDELVQQVTERVKRELIESDFLQQQIEIGIQRFVRKQREAQARARAERGRAAADRARGVRRVTANRDHVYGNPDARVSLIEYSDFECPFCKRFHPTAKRAVDDSGGRVNWVYRHFPLAFHNPLAQKEAEAAECAASLGGNDGFWRYGDELFKRTRSNGNGFPIGGLVPLAAELGFDEAAFRECFESGRLAARVQEDADEGMAIGISGTPGSVLLDNRTGRVRLVEGAVPYERLSAEIDALLSAN